MVRRLEALALHQYIKLIKQLVLMKADEIKREASKTTVQKICSNFGEVKGLAAVMVMAIHFHTKAVLQWETMRKVLENSLRHVEAIKQKYCSLEKGNTGTLKESTVNSKEKVELEEITLVIEDNNSEINLSVSPKCSKYIHVMNMFVSQMLAGGNETVDPAERMLMSLSLSNIKEACALINSQAKEILSNCNASRTLSLKNDMLRTIEELESITSEIKSIQVIQMTIKKYLDTGPYKTWEEMQVDFLRYLIQQPALHLFANELSESLISLYINTTLHITSSKRQKMMVEACLHPAITKLNATEIPVDILLELLPKLKNLNTLKVNTKITGRHIFEEYAQLFACMLRYCSKLKCLCVTFQFCPNNTAKPQRPLDVVLARYLPSTLISVSFYDGEGLNVKFLDKMAASEEFKSLNRLTLSYISSNYPLHEGFRNLIAVAVLKTTFRGGELFSNIGAQLKELNLTSVASIQIRILAECCPFLETLLLKYCTFSSSFHTELLPTFRSLKKITFIASSYFLRQESDMCIWCILQNSPAIEKLVVVISTNRFVTCFQQLEKTHVMSYLEEFELYNRHRNTFKGLVKKDFAVKMINKFPTLSFIGGIEHATTQGILSEIYPDKTFVCLHEKTVHLHEPNSEMFFLDDSDISEDVDDLF